MSFDSKITLIKTKDEVYNPRQKQSGRLNVFVNTNEVSNGFVLIYEGFGNAPIGYINFFNGTSVWTMKDGFTPSDYAFMLFNFGIVLLYSKDKFEIGSNKDGSSKLIYIYLL